MFVVESNLAALIQKYNGFVIASSRRYCLHAGVWHGEAEDLAQATWLKVATCDILLPLDAEEERWRFFLAGIARNTCRDFLKAERRRKAREQMYAEKTTKKHLADAYGELKAKLLAEEIHRVLKAQCTPKIRKVIQRRLNGHTFEDISRDLCMSIKSVSRCVRAAKEILFVVL